MLPSMSSLPYVVFLFYASQFYIQTAGQTLSPPEWLASQKVHVPSVLSSEQIKRIAESSNLERFKMILQPIAVPRVSGTPENVNVQQFITELLTQLGYTIELDTFKPKVPAGFKVDKMTNVMATLNPNAPRRLVLACHYDSKYDPENVFVGASDSAVPCAMIIDLAVVLHTRLTTRTVKNNVTLQLLFLDGEEAFSKWSSLDSLYGARNLANKLHKTANPFDPTGNSTALKSMDLMVLLDLIGPADVQFRNFYYHSSFHFNRMSAIENSLEQMSQIKTWGRKTRYFDATPLPPKTWVDDDYRPFLARGVRIFHMISTPFPSVWHRPEDNMSNVHMPTVDDLNKILRVFVCEYLGCGF